MRNLSAEDKAINMPDHYNMLTDSEKEVLLAWIGFNFKPAKGYTKTSSYGIKEYFEKNEKGFYITNGQLKGAMIAAGYKPDPKYINHINWCFNAKLLVKY